MAREEASNVGHFTINEFNFFVLIAKKFFC